MRPAEAQAARQSAPYAGRDAEIAAVVAAAVFLFNHTRALFHIDKSASPTLKHRLTPDALAKRASPFDVLNRETAGTPPNAPPEVLAVLGRSRFALPQGQITHWAGQSADGRVLAVPTGCNVALFDSLTGAFLRTLTGPTIDAYRPVFSPDGKRLASGAGDSKVRIWDVATGQLELTLEGTQEVWSGTVAIRFRREMA